MTRFFNDTNNILMDARVNEFPFPYATGSLPQTLYSMLAKSRPKIKGKESNKRIDVRAKQLLETDLEPIWRDFIEYHTSHEFYLQILEKFGHYFEQYYPQLKLKDYKAGMRFGGDADIYLECQLGINTPVKVKSSVSNPHLDHPQELWAALLYMRDPEDNAGGDLVLYKCRNLPRTYDKRQIHAEELIPYAVIPYEANSMVCFMNSPFSIHGVTEREVTDKSRLLVNISLEFTQSLFDFKRMQ